MPPRKATAPAHPASRTFKRRIRNGLGAGYVARRPGPSGVIVETHEFGAFGQEVELDALEQMRLDSLGALCEPGATLADAEAELEAKIAAYRAERSTVSAAW